jgi:hypothetical protein
MFRVSKLFDILYGVETEQRSVCTLVKNNAIKRAQILGSYMLKLGKLRTAVLLIYEGFAP